MIVSAALLSIVLPSDYVQCVSLLKPSDYLQCAFLLKQVELLLLGCWCFVVLVHRLSHLCFRWFDLFVGWCFKSRVVAPGDLPALFVEDDDVFLSPSSSGVPNVVQFSGEGKNDKRPRPCGEVVPAIGLRRNYYAVRKGFVPGIYRTRDNCRQGSFYRLHAA
jgi:hypothetical protein